MTTDTTETAAADPENMLYMDLASGRVTIELRTDLAPNHAARIKELTREGFYDGVVFHRVIEGFMAQTGDPTGTGRGGSGQKLDAEFSDANYGRGTVGMARSQSPNSGDSQFFICFNDCRNSCNHEWAIISVTPNRMTPSNSAPSSAAAANVLRQSHTGPLVSCLFVQLGLAGAQLEVCSWRRSSLRAL